LALTVLAALAGIILATWLGRALRGRDRHYAMAEFRASVPRWIDIFQQSVADRVEMVNTAAAFFRGSELNDRKDFHTFISQIMKGHPSVEMFAWAPRIPETLRSAHEEAVRKQRFPQYAIRQRDEHGQFLVAGKRANYYPILFVEPATTETQSLLGLDAGSDAVGQAALREATAAGQATVAVLPASSSGSVGSNLLFILAPARYSSVATHLAKRPPDQPEADGFLMGIVSMEKLARSWLSLPGLAIPHNIDVYISVNERNLVALHTGPQPTPLVDSTGSLASPPAKAPVEGALASREFQAGNASFRVVCVASAYYIANWERTWKPFAAIVTGLLLTGLAVAYFWLLTGRMADVERRVADRWLELREREHYIRQLIDHTSDIIFLCDEQGRILDLNQRACENLGYRHDQLLSMSLADIEVAAGADVSGALPERAADDYPRTYQTAYRRRDGTTFSVEVYATPVGIGAPWQLLTIVRDRTNREPAEGVCQPTSS
jgi:PAS domain S-box-containing protein